MSEELKSIIDRYHIDNLEFLEDIDSIRDERRKVTLETIFTGLSKGNKYLSYAQNNLPLFFQRARIYKGYVIKPRDLLVFKNNNDIKITFLYYFIKNFTYTNYLTILESFFKLLDSPDIQPHEKERYVNHYINSNESNTFKPLWFLGNTNNTNYIELLSQHQINLNNPIIKVHGDPPKYESVTNVFTNIYDSSAVVDPKTGLTPSIKTALSLASKGVSPYFMNTSGQVPFNNKTRELRDKSVMVTDAMENIKLMNAQKRLNFMRGAENKGIVSDYDVINKLMERFNSSPINLDSSNRYL